MGLPTERELLIGFQYRGMSDGGDTFLDRTVLDTPRSRSPSPPGYSRSKSPIYQKRPPGRQSRDITTCGHPVLEEFVRGGTKTSGTKKSGTSRSSPYLSTVGGPNLAGTRTGTGYQPNDTGYQTNGNGYPNGTGTGFPNGTAFQPNGTSFQPNGTGFQPNGSGYPTNGYPTNGTVFPANGTMAGYPTAGYPTESTYQPADTALPFSTLGGTSTPPKTRTRTRSPTRKSRQSVSPASSPSGSSSSSGSSSLTNSPKIRVRKIIIFVCYYSF